MRTVVISDLHLGAPGDSDLLRRAELRRPLLELLEGAGRLVLLGDTLELRHSPHRDAAAVARPFLEEVGAALGPKGEVLMLGGNHDHGLVAGWMEGRLQTEAPGFLGLEQRIEPAEAGRLAAGVARHLRPARLSLAYPGAWLRPDVYALHGHYSDLHTTMPTFERLAAGARPDDYEAALSPLYAWMHQLTQRSEHALGSTASGTTSRTWSLLVGRARRRHPLRAAALRLGFAGAVVALNRLGLGPLEREVSPAALRRAGLHGIGEVLRRLEVTAPYVLFGHTHRSGPWPDDDEREWTTAAGTRLVNTGSWVYQAHFLPPTPNASPYWPGTAVVLEDGRPPQLRRLLGNRGHDVLRPGPA